MRASIAQFRSTGIAVTLMTIGFALATTTPTALAIGVVLVVGGAAFGTLCARQRDWRSLARHLLLAFGTFGYPLFLGGVVLPWAAFAVHSALLVGDWHALAVPRERIAIAQAFAAAFAVGLSAAAAQFFFPAAWRWVAGAAVASYLLLLVTSIPSAIVHRMPAPAIGAIVLALSEGLVILHRLPTHWVVNGVVLTFALAMFLERRRVPRVMFASLLVSVLLFGAFVPGA